MAGASFIQKGFSLEPQSCFLCVHVSFYLFFSDWEFKIENSWWIMLITMHKVTENTSVWPKRNHWNPQNLRKNNLKPRNRFSWQIIYLVLILVIVVYLKPWRAWTSNRSCDFVWSWSMQGRRRRVHSRNASLFSPVFILSSCCSSVCSSCFCTLFFFLFCFYNLYFLRLPP